LALHWLTRFLMLNRGHENAGEEHGILGSRNGISRDFAAICLSKGKTTMTSYAITAPAAPVLPVRGSGAVFPVRRVYCIGRNYAAHTIEMGGDPNREPPFFFQKNPDNLDVSGEFPYPVKSSDVHHELEMVVALKSGGVNIPVERALDHVFGYAVGLDMTRRDLQGEAKDLRRPWEIGKAFERSAPCSALVPAAEIGHPSSGLIQLKVNGAVRQTGDLGQMIWKVAEMISYLSDYFELAAGDVIMSGTPSGVGAVVKGDVMEAEIAGVGTLRVTVV
jgi:fumarylpyruvate hydrolase